MSLGLVVLAAVVAAGSNAADACALPTYQASNSFVRPASGPLTRKFGALHHPLFNAVRWHEGIDFGGRKGDAVLAAAGGVVGEAGVRAEYGKIIVVDHGGGLTTAYAHLAVIDVKPGNCVRAGQRIGRRGNTGLSSEPHLHFEVRRSGRAIDPESLLRGQGR